MQTMSIVFITQHKCVFLSNGGTLGHFVLKFNVMKEVKEHVTQCNGVAH